MNSALFTIDPAHTQVEFAVRHLMISTVMGSFKEVTGTVRYDPSNPNGIEVSVTINPASIDTRGSTRRPPQIRGFLRRRTVSRHPVPRPPRERFD